MSTRPSTGRRPRGNCEETDMFDHRRVIGVPAGRAKRAKRAKRANNRRDRRAARRHGYTD